MIFASPETREFYDNRILISWIINQPESLPPLKELTVEILAFPKVEFEPDQSSKFKIPALEDNEIILNWVIKKPKVLTEINLIVKSLSFQETQTIVIKP
jgi:hypothetical protein